MKHFEVAHKKSECIGCALCAEVASGYRQMDEDGEAQLVQPIRNDARFEYAHGFEEDRRILKLAEQGCPVGIIRIG